MPHLYEQGYHQAGQRLVKPMFNACALPLSHTPKATIFESGKKRELSLTMKSDCTILSDAPWGTFFFPDEPQLEESGCPGNQTWVEGTEEMLSCIPKGNPTPTLVCTWNGTIFNLHMPQKATQNHTGTYCCTATNRLGSVSKDISVVVQGEYSFSIARPMKKISLAVGGGLI